MSIRKIMLISPPATLDFKIEPKRGAAPLGLAYLGATLEKEGYEVRILDAYVEGYENETKIDDKRTRVGLSEVDIAKAIEDYHPDMVGVSAMFTDHSKSAHDVCRVIKSVNNDLLVVMGGVHPTAIPTVVLEDKNVDCVICAEAEYSFIDFLRCLEVEGDITKVEGIAYRQNGHVKIQPKKSFISDLDKLPLPARHLLPMQKYFSIGRAYREPSQREPAISMITSRCCPAHCNFCLTHKMMGNYRTRSVDNVLSEMEYLIKQYGMREIYFLDDNLTFDKERIKQIFNGMIERKYNLKWHAANGIAIYALDEELIDKMKASGCYKVIISVESGDQETLSKIMRKPVNISRAKPLIRYMKSVGLKVESLFVIGSPDETKEQIQHTVDFAREMDFDYVSFPIATPFPGTKFYDICKAKGYLVDDFRFENLKFGIGNIRTPEFTPEYVEKVRQDAWREINFVRRGLEPPN